MYLYTYIQSLPELYVMSAYNFSTKEELYGNLIKTFVVRESDNELYNTLKMKAKKKTQTSNVFVVS